MTTVARRLLALVFLLPLSALAENPQHLPSPLDARAYVRSMQAGTDARSDRGALPDDVLLPLAAAVPLRLAVGSLTAPIPGHGSRADGFRAGLAVTPGGSGAGLRAELSWFEARLADARGAAEPDRDGIARRGLMLRISRSLGSF